MKKQDYTEYEVKFYPIDKEVYRKKLLSVGAKLIIPERKMVRAVADWRDNPSLAERDCVRVRNEGKVVRLSFKTFANNAQKLTDQQEIEVEVSDFENTVKILKRTGLKFNRYQETAREEWDLNGVQITLDSWPGLLPFSEIEGHSENEVQEAANLLGFSWDDKIICPASDLYARVFGVTTREALERISNISFSQPPFAEMKKVWPQKEI